MFNTKWTQRNGYDNEINIFAARLTGTLSNCVHEMCLQCPSRVSVIFTDHGQDQTNYHFIFSNFDLNFIAFCLHLDSHEHQDNYRVGFRVM